MSFICCACGEGDEFGIAKYIGPSGQVKYPWFCRSCGTRTSLYEPNHQHLIYEAVFDGSAINACEVCGMMGAEVHHWLPRKISPNDCEKWPIGYLCQKCHAEWHTMMTK